MRTCPKCGWEFPSTYVNTKCKFCGTTFDVQICGTCKKLVPTYKFYRRSDGRLTRRCPDCNRKSARDWDNANKERRLARVYKFYDKRLIAAEKKMYDWMEKLQELPFKVMNEDEWLETCRYFGGCAICGNEYIETRHFFIPFEEGGRYAVWNMIPLCGPCAAGLPKSIGNPFKWFDKYFGNAEALGLNEERKNKLVSYLYNKMKEASE